MSMYYNNISDQKIVPVKVGPSIDLDGHTYPSFYRRIFKRMFDVFAVMLAAPLILPFIGILALIVARQGGRPFYSQSRIGRHGRVFKMWKLRSMVCDADARLQKHLAADPDACAEWDATQKLKNDPRITPFGRLLRKSSMDELPQLWNVLRGEMSLIGPRPMMVSQQDMYPGNCYYKLSPGITGTWQISARNKSTFADRAKFDSDYNQNLSFGNDLRILFRTVTVVLKATGY